jgi:NADPH-dependent curcumin reductase CurA
MPMNRVVRLVKRPAPGLVTPDCFEIRDEPLPEPGEGEFRVRISHVSLDPAMRGWVNEGKSYVPPVGLGDVMRSFSAGVVEASRNPDFQEGEAVVGLFGVQTHAVSDGKGVQRADTSIAPLQSWIGGLGMPGLTAYFGLFEIGKPRPGETLVVSAASGAVGAVVCQLGKLAGARVVGIAGGPDKCAYVKDELGVDAVIDYKAETDLAKALAAACPDGIDVYFDNVGGPVTDAIANLFNLRARMIVCGLISHYNMPEGYVGPSILRSVLTNRVTIQGMIVFDWHDRWPAGIAQLGRFVKAGKLKYKEDVTEGLENAPATFIGMLEGRNFGKTLVKISE